MRNNNTDQKFVQEYLYIEKELPRIPEKKEKEKQEEERGIVVINFFDIEETE